VTTPERNRIVVWPDPLDRRRLAKIGEVPGWWKKELSDITFKPVGLWYAFGWEWIEWCRDSDFAVDRIKHAYRVTLDKKRVLSLQSQDEILEFTTRYQCQGNPDFSDAAIDWSRLRNDYAGVENPSYFWDLRFSRKARWYYSWDVASGCVWDPSIILDLKKIEIPPIGRTG